MFFQLYAASASAAEYFGITLILALLGGILVGLSVHQTERDRIFWIGVFCTAVSAFMGVGFVVSGYRPEIISQSIDVLVFLLVAATIAGNISGIAAGILIALHEAVVGRNSR